MDAIIFKAGKDAGAGRWRQGKILKMAFEGARVEELPRGFEKPGVVEGSIMNDEIGHIGSAPVLVSVDDGSMREETPIGVFEFERSHTGRIAAQKTLPFSAEFAPHVTGESPFTTAEGSLVESHITLPAHEGELYSVKDRGFARAVDANEVSGSLAINGGIFKEMPVDEADAG
jgi:hypothetical protein